MSSLAKERCEACRADAPAVTEKEFLELRPQIPAWDVAVADGVPRLVRDFPFPAYADALAFTQAVGQLAEAEGHHPQIVTEYGNVRVAWWTHKIRNLHRNDFICAAKTDALYRGDAPDASGR